MKTYPTASKILSAIAAISLLWANVAFAGQGRVTITVKNPDPFLGNHSWFVYERDSGTTIEDVATVKNFSNEPTIIDVYAVDATSSEGGSFILTFEDEPQRSIGDWTEVKKTSVTVGPKETIDIPFEIQIPNGAPPGQYLGGIVVENRDPTDETETNRDNSCESDPDKICNTGVAIKTRIGARVYLTVTGEAIEDIEVTDFDAKKDIIGNTTFHFTIQNNGTIAYQPEATIKVYDGMGNLYETVTDTLGSSAPGTTIFPSIKMKKRPFFGTFSANATVSLKRQFGTSTLHGAAEEQVSSLNFYVLPWELILPPILLVLLGAGVCYSRKLNHQRYLAHSEEYIVQENDNLMAIAKECNTPWKEIASHNKIKAPYIIKPGDKLRIPKKDE